MNEVIIIERPCSIGWEDIRQTLLDAHRKNLENGLVVRSTTLDADQLREQVADGKCYVALDGEKLVGIAAVRIKTCDQWYCHGKVAHFMLDSVLPDYQGMGIYSRLQEFRYAYVEAHGINVITTNTATRNERMINMLPQLGFHRGRLFKVADTNHFSITWVKWLSNEPNGYQRWFQYERTAVKTLFRFILDKLMRK